MTTPRAATAPRPILLLVGSLERDGAETQLVMLAKRLQEWGWPVRIVAMLPIDAFGDELDGLDVHFLGMRRRGVNTTAIRRFLRLAGEQRPAALVSFTYPANLFGRLAGRFARIPVIVSSIRGERVGGRAKELAMRATARLDSVTTTNSSRVARSLMERRLVAGRRVEVIPNGVDLRRFAGVADARDRVRAAIGVPEGAFVWLAVGRLEPVKDYPNVLRAMTRLTRAPAHRLYIAGGGSQRADLERLATALRVSERVTFLGARSDVPTLLAAADALVLPSANEGMPNALMEAFAAGTPAVATDVGGVREILVSGESGFVVPPGDAAALAAAMDRLMQLPPSALRELGASGREHVERRFSVAAMAGRWRDLLTSEIASRSG